MRVEETPEERLPAPVELAAYYVVAEALTNVVKYADANRARVQVGNEDGDHRRVLAVLTYLRA